MGTAGAKDLGQACTRADTGRGVVRTSQCGKQSEQGIEYVNHVRKTPRDTVVQGVEAPGRTLGWSVHLEHIGKRVTQSQLPFKTLAIV